MAGPFTTDQQRKLRGAATAATTADVAALTSSAAVASPPTKAEYDALRQDHINLRTAHQALLVNLRAAGIVDP